MLAGAASAASAVADIPTLASTAKERWDLDEMDIFQAVYEVGGVDRTALLPPALHPTDPTLLILTAWIGLKVTLVQARISCRSGVRARALLLDSVCPERGVGDRLRLGWGFNVRPGEVALTGGRDTVRIEAPGIEFAIDRLEDFDADGVQLTASMHLVTLPAGERLIQIEPEVRTESARRGRPGAVRVARFPKLHAVSAAIIHGRLTLVPPRFATRVDLPAFRGTEKL